jgi:plastocyanin
MSSYHLIAAALVAATPTAAGQAPPPVVPIMLDGYYGMPTTIRLAAGRPVTLEFVNRSWNRHNFAARSFFASSRILGGNVHKGNITLEPREVERISLIPVRGTYRTSCVLHRHLGMRGQIVVN